MRHSPRLRIRLIGIVAVISLAAYALARVFYFFMDIDGPFNRFFAFLLILGETYMVVHAFGYVINTLRLSRKKHGFHYRRQPDRDLPSVAVVVPAKHEPRDVLERTFIALRSLDYPNKQIYLLDDSTKPSAVAEAKALARKYRIHYFHPGSLHGAKAGILNDFLRRMDEKYLAIFDADQNPMPDFLRKVVSIAEASGNIAFVQTPQVYTNIGESRIAKNAEMQQSVFYETLCEAKGSINAMFCCGTNALIRRSALLEVGGFDENVITEDFATSVQLHMRGYRSVYFNHVRVFGMAPETLKSYFKQQARWAGGTTRVLRSILYHLATQPWKLSFGQWWEYLLASSYYFVGWAFFILMLCPIFYLLFGVPSYSIGPAVYIGTFIPYFTWNLSLFYGTMQDRHYHMDDVFHGVIMSSLSFPILMKATVLGLFGKRMQFVVTPKGQSDQLPIAALWPWIAMIGINILAIAVGLTKISVNPYAVIVNCLWCLYHCFILSQVFALNAVKQIPKRVQEPLLPLWQKRMLS